MAATGALLPVRFTLHFLMLRPEVVGRRNSGRQERGEQFVRGFCGYDRQAKQTLTDMPDSDVILDTR